ncbi:hypothetical protein [uncultured Desulfobacter sp.]|uniref:hypothetical protein n=1 Tax=uncultured Desulfobacter sp. TaxID=240139 RepID=UPI0029F4C839|nr:hypothetical protein [uncultured Desulfobacter sp.]
MNRLIPHRQDISSPVLLILTHAEDEWQLISTILFDVGNLRRASDLQTALTLHTGSPFDLILADIELLSTEEPGMSAFRAVNPFVQLPPPLPAFCCWEKPVQVKVRWPD